MVPKSTNSTKDPRSPEKAQKAKDKRVLKFEFFGSQYAQS